MLMYVRKGFCAFFFFFSNVDVYVALWLSVNKKNLCQKHHSYVQLRCIYVMSWTQHV